MMPRPALALLAAAILGACSTNSGIETTPTFSAARFVPRAPPAQPTPAPAKPDAAPAPSVTGSRAVALANREAMVDPNDTTMRGATWLIDDADASRIYRVPTAPGRVTTILLPSGERFNGAVGGDVASFLINVAYAGPRPAVSILPRTAQAKGNLQLVTTGGFYSFDLIVNRNVAINLVDVGREQAAPHASAANIPQPQGDFTRLALVPLDGPPPAWAPAEAWADSYKMVARFNGPLPTLPSLLAGQKGEQLVSYRSQLDGQTIYLVTSRRVTEAELRLGAERLRITVDPDAIRAGIAADPAQGTQTWQPAGAMPEASVAPSSSSVAVVVVPGNTTPSQPTGTLATPPPYPPVEASMPTPDQPARQPPASRLDQEWM